MAISMHNRLSPWPATLIDPERAWLDYDIAADELLIYFAGAPVPAVSSPLDAPGFADVAILLGVGADDEPTGAIVGIQVSPMLLGAVQERPAWAALVWAVLAADLGVDLRQERLPGFIDDVADAFRRHWRPAPAAEAQMPRLAGEGP